LDLGGLRQLGRGLELPFGVDHFGAPLPLGLGLLRHGAMKKAGELSYPGPGK
jgi:hypothetical protein